MIRPATILILSLICPLTAQEQPATTVVIKTPPGQMKYDLAQFSVRPGERVHLTLTNQDEMPHNLVLCKPSDTNDKGLEVAQAAWLLAEKGEELAWVPQHERVLVSGKMAPPHGQQTLDFTAPEQLGDYPYVCTFPGHAMSMNGIMRVALSGPKITELKYKLYQGAWTKLPDFATLTASRSGEIVDGLLGWKFDDYKNQFGMVFEGKLSVPKQGKHTFYLACDDGAELFIDGKSVLRRDGIHPAGVPQQRALELAAGGHAITVNYFQAAGQAELYVGWAGPGFSETALSNWVPDSRKAPSIAAADKFSGMELGPEKERAIIYRNFLEGSSPRGIAVGFPAQVNVCFDADQMSLTMLWRGAFMDAKRHWTDRGAGNQPPLGYAVVHPTGNDRAAGIATLADPSTTPWPAASARAAGVQFNGYVLDAHGFPTFSYNIKGLTVQERYETPSADATAMPMLVRILRLSGTASEPTFLRAAAGEIRPESGQYLVNSEMLLSAQGGVLQARERELILPLDPATSKELRLTYQWK